ncbi:MAG: zinc ABC transporter substrate-binding protein [Synergistaceae bacterium]|nr:zinc ABC transporter substrate-binding protein [Synergistaceae bacterium]
MRFKRLLLITSFLLLITSTAYAKIVITCSSFPVFDFARNIAGNDAEIKLLLRPGMEPHEFEPSPMDIVTLNDSDVFIYTGPELEHWAEKISHSLENTRIINASENIELVNNDPHIWMDMQMASHMAANILTGLIMADSQNSESYMDNAQKFLHELAELDGDFMSLPRNKTLVFAGEFAANYFIARYGFKYISAYDGENEPGIKRITEIIDFIRENGTKYILADDFGGSQITRSIANETGTQILTFSTAHASSENDSFIAIMRQNLESLRLALND